MTSPIVPLTPVPPTSPGDLVLEMGVQNNLPWGSLLGLEEKKETVLVDKLVRMHRESGQARMLVRLLTLPAMIALQEAEWVLPSEDASGGPEVELMTSIFTLPPQGGGMEISFMKIIRQLVMCTVTGFQVFEKVYHVPDEGDLKGKVILRKLAHRDPRTIEFLADDRGEYAGVRQVASVGGRTINVVMGPAKIFYFAANEAENPMYGVSYFNAAWWHWDKVIKMYYLSHLAATFSAVPARVGEEPPNASRDQRLAFRAGLRDFGLNTAMCVPTGFKVDLKTSTTSGFDYVKYIEHHLSQMSRSVLAEFMESSDRAVVIDNSTTGADDIFVQSIEAFLGEIAEKISSDIAPPLIDMNIGSGVYPVFRFGKLSDASKDLIKELFSALAVTSTEKATPEFFRELEKKLTLRLGLDINYDEIDAREEEEQIEKEELKQKVLDAGGIPGHRPPPPAVDPNAPPVVVAPPARNRRPAVDDRVAASASSWEDMIFALSQPGTEQVLDAYDR